MRVVVANLGSQRCSFRNTYAQLSDRAQRSHRNHSTLMTQVEVWRCMRSVSLASRKYYEKDVVVESELLHYRRS